MIEVLRAALHSTVRHCPGPAAVYLRRGGLLRLRHGAAVRAPAEGCEGRSEAAGLHLTFYDRLLAFDHLKHQLHIIAAADVKAESPRKAYDRALADIDAIERKLASGMKKQALGWSSDGKKPKLKVHAGTSREEFIARVKRAKEYIAAGDIFQVVLSLRLDFKAPSDPFQSIARCAR